MIRCLGKDQLVCIRSLKTKNKNWDDYCDDQFRSKGFICHKKEEEEDRY